MTKQTHIKVSGVWKPVVSMWQKVNGVWQKDVMPHIRVGGEWKACMQYFVPDPTIPDSNGFLYNSGLYENYWALEVIKEDEEANPTQPTFEDDHILMWSDGASGNRYTSWAICDAIDISAFDTLRIFVKSPSSWHVTLGIQDGKQAGIEMEKSKEVELQHIQEDDEEEYEIELDISEYTGDWNVIVGWRSGKYNERCEFHEIQLI